MKTKEEIAEILHNAYEDYSRMVSWKTQESCRVEFKDLPEKNKDVMLHIASIVQDMILDEVNKVLRKQSSENYDSNYGYNY